MKQPDFMQKKRFNPKLYERLSYNIWIPFWRHSLNTIFIEQWKTLDIIMAEHQSMFDSLSSSVSSDLYYFAFAAALVSLAATRGFVVVFR